MVEQGTIAVDGSEVYFYGKGHDPEKGTDRAYTLKNKTLTNEKGKIWLKKMEGKRCYRVRRSRPSRRKIILLSFDCKREAMRPSYRC